MGARSTCRFFCAVAPAIAWFPSAATALPLPNGNSDALRSLQRAAAADPALDNVQFFIDHDPAQKIVYVSPAASKVQAGAYETYRRPRCDVLERAFDSVYHMPESDYRLEYESPYFHYTQGIKLRRDAAEAQYQAELARLPSPGLSERDGPGAGRTVDPAERARRDDLKAQAARLREEAAAQEARVDEYDRQAAELRVAIKAKSEAGATYSDLSAEFGMLDAILAKRLVALEEGFRCRQEANRFAGDSEVLDRIDDDDAKRRRRDDATTRQDIENRRARAIEVISEIEANAAHEWDIARSMLTALERTPVGRANAQYVIFDGEIGAVRRHLETVPELRDYAVQNLDLTNVTLSPIRSRLEMRTSDDAHGTAATIALYEVGSAYGQTTEIGQQFQAAPALFRDGEGKILPQVERALDSGSGTGHFETIVSQAAYCSEPTAPATRTVTYYNDFEGEVTAEAPIYTPRRSRVLAQQVGLNYDYFIKAEPISAKCRLEKEKFEKFVTTAGISRDFFGEKRWDNKTFESAVEGGVKCEVSLAPQEGAEDPVAERQRMQDMVQRMSQEMMAEALSAAGASFDVIEETKNEDDLGAALDRIQDAHTPTYGFCFHAYTCWITNIVLHVAHNIFGESVESTHSASSKLSTDLVRLYTENSYRRVRGVAKITLEVQP